MPTITLDEATLAVARRHLRSALPEMISSHVAEALASSLGFKSSHALAAAAKSRQDVDAPDALTMARRFSSRAIEIRPQPSGDDVPGTPKPDATEIEGRVIGTLALLVKEIRPPAAEAATVKPNWSGPAIERRLQIRLYQSLGPTLEAAWPRGVSDMEALQRFVFSIDDIEEAGWKRIAGACKAILAQMMHGDDIGEAARTTGHLDLVDCALFSKAAAAREDVGRVMAQALDRLKQGTREPLGTQDVRGMRISSVATLIGFADFQEHAAQGFVDMVTEGDAAAWDRTAWTEREGRAIALEALAEIYRGGWSTETTDHLHVVSQLLADTGLPRARVASEILAHLEARLQHGEDLGTSLRPVLPPSEWTLVGPAMAIVAAEGIPEVLTKAVQRMRDRVQAGKRTEVETSMRLDTWFHSTAYKMLAMTPADRQRKLAAMADLEADAIRAAMHGIETDADAA